MVLRYRAQKFKPTKGKSYRLNPCSGGPSVSRRYHGDEQELPSTVLILVLVVLRYRAEMAMGSGGVGQGLNPCSGGPSVSRDMKKFINPEYEPS